MDSKTGKQREGKKIAAKKEEVEKQIEKQVEAAEEKKEEDKDENDGLKDKKEIKEPAKVKEPVKEASNEKNETGKEETRGKKRENEPDEKGTSKKVKTSEGTSKEEDTTTKAKPEAKKDTDKNEKKAEKPKYVFGQSTSFGKFGGFGKFETSKNPFAKKGGESKAAAKIFGSGSSFGNLFKSASTNSKPIFDKPFTGKATSLEKDEKKKDKEVQGNCTGADIVYRTVHLQKQDMKSGEEDETTLYQVKAKLYWMDLEKLSEGWKERGVGILKVNKLKKPTDSYRSRLIMRQVGNLKLILNLPIAKNIKVLKGMTSSFAGNKFIRIQTIEQGKPIQYALKIGQVENVPKVYDSIVGEIPK